MSPYLPFFVSAVDLFIGHESLIKFAYSNPDYKTASRAPYVTPMPRSGDFPRP